MKYLVGLVLASICGCVSGISDVSIDDFTTRWIEAHCANLVACGAWDSDVDCITDASQYDWFPAMTAAVKRGTITWDPVAADACIDATATASCDLSSAAYRSPATTPCVDMMKGTVAVAGACYFDGECMSGNCTLSTTDCDSVCCSGTCADPRPAPVAVGQSCATAPCADSFCDPTTAICTALPAGSLCTGDYDCAYGMLCVGGPGMCTPASAPGQPCVGSGVTATCIGDPGLVCNPATSTCVYETERGGACDPTVDLCKGDLVCDATSKTCTEAPDNGQACADRCRAPYHCGSDSVCHPLADYGDTCMTDDDCKSQLCQLPDERCVATPVCD